MATSILATKLYIPPPRAQLVPRPRLIEQLNDGLHRKMTLITAPAGYGKTTMLSEWIPQSERCVTWISLDDGDNDPVRFWAYFIAALQKLDAEIGRDALALMRTPLLPPSEAILTLLLNEIAAFPDKFALVLDDYYVIDAKPVDKALTFLLEHLPPQMHLVIATREDPNLPLARLRARDQLTELRAADLRFTPGETAAFLNQVMGFNLSAEEVTSLDIRTEGWIVGLQLAALSMRGREDVHEFIRAFTGENRYIVDYLIEEVLRRQSEGIRSFLLQTSILDWLSGPLCDAVTGQEEGNARLDALERGNFFVVPVDDKRHWYRYHHLFAEVLRLHLMAEQPDQVATLHRRASEWYEQNGSAADAIRHALTAEDFKRAADLVEMAVPAMRKSRQEATLLGWLKALPDELLRFRPVLSVHYAGALLLGGQLEGAEARLQDAERWLEPMADTSERPEASAPETGVAEMVVVDNEEFRRLPGAIAMYRSAIALAQGDVPATVKYARRVLDLVSEDDHLLRGSAAGFLGLAYWASGDLEAAQRSYAECKARVLRVGHVSDAIGVAIAMADLQIAQGRLREAMRTYEQGLQLATEQGTPALAVRGAADMYVGMSMLEREHNDLGIATQRLLRSQELGEHIGLPQNRYRWKVAMARIREAQGDLDSALELLNEAERLYVGDFSPNVRPVAASKTRVWVAQGRLGEALDWAQKQGLSVEDNLSYLREFEHITLARILLARYRSDPTDRSILEAMGLLERLLKAAEEGGRAGSAIEILVLQALAHHAQGDIPAALIPLQRAFTLAEPEGYVRMFVDEGPPMAQLLLEAAAHGILPRQGSPDYTGKLLAAIKAEQQPVLAGRQASPGRGAGESPLSGASQSLIEPEVQPAKTSLVEPLSQRELEILRLFKTELSGPEIARELVIALSTVRSHTKSIFSKLGVNNRREAVKRAAELGLI